MGTGTVARPLLLTRQRPATPPNPDSDSKSIDAKPPAKRQRRAPKSGPGKKSGRPKKIPPTKTGLLSLPAEIIGRIASFLLPPTINVEDGFLPPWELPYRAPRTKSVQAKVKEYRYGGIPSGVRDVLNLARTCRKCESGVGLVIGKIGDGRSDGKKRTMYISVPQEEVTECPPRQHCVDESKIKKVFDRIKASSEGLEQLVVHQCCHFTDYHNGLYDHDDAIISRLEPFQTTATSFPNLKYLQIGPNLCGECLSAVLHLFVGKEFTRAKRYSSTGQLVSDSNPEEEGEDNDQAKLSRMAIWDPHGRRNRPNTFNGPLSVAASSPRFVDFDVAAAPNLASLQLFIPAQIKYGHDSDILKGILRLIPPSTSIRMFQVWLRENVRWSGFGASGTVNAYVCKDVKVVEEELTEWAKKEKEKSMTVQERLLAKFQADAAKVLPPKKKKEVVAIMEITEEEVESVDNKDDDEGTTPSEPDVKQEMSDVEAELNGGFSDSEAGHDSNDAKGPKMTNAERHAIYSHRASARQYSPILSSIAAAMPDLIGLSVLRQGTYMAEITEGTRLLDSEVELWVEPLLKLESLQYLDLGLAISGIKEVSDFPIGLSITQSRKGRETAKATGNDIQALKRRKYEFDIKKAVEEGDKWRLEVLKRFLIPKSNDVPQSLADAESTAGSSTAGNGNGNGNEDEGSAVTWPKGLKSGYIYSTDLVNRLRGNGLAIPWKVVGKSVQLGQPKRIKL